jgi:hypothetical protein
MVPDPSGEMYAWIAMAVMSAIASAIGISTVWRRHR